jgi:hypothetical protein
MQSSSRRGNESAQIQIQCKFVTPTVDLAQAGRPSH